MPEKSDNGIEAVLIGRSVDLLSFYGAVVSVVMTNQIENFSVFIHSNGWTFSADSTTSVLLSAQLANIRLASSCRNGTCRTCICRLQAGSVRYEIAWPGLSLDEKREGFILPCVAIPTSDLVLDSVHAAKLFED